ncbi:hypothetical protein PQX77_007899 [Marasmius sp. AFHP31]|nr:hypothetical protein PQX77_007899 [Marasmius sp. AFHP31]
MSSSFSPSQAELSLVSQIFAQADTQKLGILKGDDAVRIFGGAKLAPTVLGEIWSIADEDNNGWLSRKSTTIALRLIGWAQKGEKVTKDLISKSGPTPVIEGFSPLSAQHTGMSIPKSPPPTGGFPPLTPADKAKFNNMFVKAGPVNGLLSADQARDIFVKSKLSNDMLLHIWNLADTQNRGALDATDFALGMYFIQGVMTKTISNLPESLPPGLYQQAQMVAAPLSQHNTGTRSPSVGSFPPPSRPPVQPQYTGQPASILKPQGTGMGGLQQQNTGLLQPNSTGRVPPTLPARPNASQVGSGVFGAGTGPGTALWDVTAQEKANADRFFDTLDPSKQGFIEGDVAVPFMLESKLPDDVLAHIWDLSDLHNNGRLTKDCFAVAMHLIQKKLNGGELPESIPESLIPPAMRATGTFPFPPPSTNTTRPAPPPPPRPAPEKDLFSFDDTPPSSATSNGPFNIPVQSTGSHPSAISSPAPQSTSRDPFGGRDLMSDDDEPQTTAALHDRSAEIGNVQNQLNSTSRSLETAKSERANMEETLANQAVQLSSLQTQLSVAKAAYETETKALASLKERYATQTAEIQKIRQELITAESDLSAVRVEKSEIEGGVLRDKEEVRELHRKMAEAGKEAETLKVQTEKAKKDSKQQKGLLAIAKKQLSSKEAERAKAAKELEEANAEVAAATKEREQAETELDKLASSPPSITSSPIPAPVSSQSTGIATPERSRSPDSLAFAAAQPLPTSPDPQSPSGGSTKSNNPFERLAMSGSPRPQSPFLPFANASISTPPVGDNKPVEEKPEEKATADASDDDPFGFSQMNNTSATPPAATGQETPKGESQVPASLVISPDRVSQSLNSPTSANEDFTTPPSTATFPLESPPRQTTLDATASKFPDVDDFNPPTATLSSVAEGKKKAEEPVETDLGSSLKELDVDDSDSSDEDEVPLAKIQKRLSTDINTATKAQAPTAADASFDDIFGGDSDAAPSATPAKADAFGAPIKENGDANNVFGTPQTPHFPTTVSHVASPTEAGVNAFDEAMGKISPNASSATSAPQFSSFDAAFDDNFDFGAAGGTSLPPPTANGHATTNGDGFDSLFASQPASDTAPAASTPSSTTATTTIPPAPTASTVTTNTQASNGPSFDEVFSGFGSSPSLSLDTQGAGTAAPQTSSPAQSARQDTDSLPKQQFPPAAGVGTSSRQSSSSIARSVSPTPGQKSPPPRTASPKPHPRPSTASSFKDTLDVKPPEKTPPTRHSKLSIRLPFGRKKKDKDAPPVPQPSSMLTPPQEEPDTRGTPAAEDDADAVKQLTAMGFSRSQAVEALERYGYDIPRALNSLLGQG